MGSTEKGVEVVDDSRDDNDATTGSTSQADKPVVTDNDVRSSKSADDDDNAAPDKVVVNKGRTRAILGKIFWTPPWCRHDPSKPPEFSLFQNVLFAFAGAFTVANLYYNHPILNILANEFGVSYVEISRIPTLMQSGYAVGLLFICPLGDLFPRRPYTLILVFFTATLW